MPRLSEASTEVRFHRPEKVSLPDLAYDAVLDAIMSGSLPPGARLSIDELTRQLNMSNTPIREALSRATAERLVVQVTNKGYIVAPMLTEAAYHQLFETRHLLETHALRLLSHQSGAVDRLVAMNEGMATLSPGPRYEDFRAFNRADEEFHRGLVNLSGNTFLIKAWEDLRFHLHVGRLYLGSGVIDFGDALAEHRAITAALRHDDREQAVSALSLHIRSAQKRLLRLLRQKENGSA